MAQDKETKLLITADAKQAQAELKKTAKASQDAADTVSKNAQKQTKAINEVGQSAKQAAFAMRQVPAQFTDIVVSLQGGQNPMQVLLQQGGQLKDLFGGTGNAARALGGYIAGLITPTTVVVGAAVGLAAAFAAGEAQSSRLRQSILASGNASGTSVGQLEDLVQKIGEVTRDYGTAREAAEALAGSGQISAQNLEAAMRGVAAGVKLTGRDVQDLTEDFIDIGKDPVKAVTDLNNKYNFLTVAVFDQIKALQEQGKTQEAATLAANVYADTLAGRTGEMVQNLGYVQRAWEGIKNAASGTLNEVLRIGRDKTMDTDLEDARRRLEFVQNRPKVGTEEVLKSYADEERKLERQIKAIELTIKTRDALTGSIGANDKKQIASRKAYDDFVKSNAVGLSKLAVDQKQVLVDWQNASKAYEVGSEGYIKSVRVRDEKLKKLQDDFIDSNKTKKTKTVKGLVNPLRQAFEIGKDDLAAIKQSLDQANALVQDQLNFANQVYDQAYRDNTISLQAYFDTRLGIIETAAQKEKQTQLDLIAALQNNRLKVESQPAKTQQDIEAKRNRLADIDRQIATANQKIADTDRERLQSATQIRIERERETKALQESLDELALQNAIDTGADTSEQRAKAIRDKLTKQYAQLNNLPGAQAIITQTIDIAINKDSLQRAEQDFNTVLQRMRNSEDSIQVQLNAGLLTEQQARESIITLHQQTAQELEKLIPLLEQAANAIGPEAAERVAAFKNQIAGLKNTVNAVQTQIEGAFKTGIQGVFTDIANGATSAERVAVSFFRTVVRGLADIAAQRLTTSIFEGIMGKLPGATPSDSGGGGFFRTASKFLASFFHTGGVVGNGASVKKPISQVMFNAIPRYHTGGIAGLAPNEVPSVLMGGPKGTREEVLTADDPRHIDNGGMANNKTVVQNTNIIAIDQSDVQNAAFGGGADKKILNIVNVNRAAFRSALGV